ncbi:MAG: glycerophosphodiester phosphodiesterase family protein [Paracoccaceae bacterium]|nr:glycerophosphodiester phosphodiesterase family protein [Paracoccaceae bacterium]
MTPPLPKSFVERPLAHRALHDIADGRPENSLAAARAAVERGYGIEIDIQMSADGCAMVFHDYALERMTSATGAVRQRTRAELATMTLKGGSEGIPTLEEILDVVAGAVPLLVEIKDQDGGLGPEVDLLEMAVARAVDGYGGEVALMSFNPHSVSALQALAPGRPRGLTTEDFPDGVWPIDDDRLHELREIPDFARVAASFISHDHTDLAHDRVTELKDQGASVLCWTVRSPEEEAEARKVAHNITFEGYLP